MRTLTYDFNFNTDLFCEHRPFHKPINQYTQLSAHFLHGTLVRLAHREAGLSADKRKGMLFDVNTHIVQELCENRGGRPGLSVLTSLLVSVDVKLY